jgi:mannose-6-phosphate isomerase-like protein (cupin superfamily)
MLVRCLDDAPRTDRGGQVSHLLFAPGLGSRDLTVTWVRGEPGSQQGLHVHENSEQIYVVVRGRGLVIVDGEERELEAGTAVLIPAGVEHTTTPPFPTDVNGNTWQPRYERKPATDDD